MSDVGPPQPPESPGPDDGETGELADFFHTEDLPDKAEVPKSHRAAPIETSPFLARLLAPATAVVVVIVVILLLIWINGGSSGNGQSPAAIGTRPPVATPTPSSTPTTTTARQHPPHQVVVTNHVKATHTTVQPHSIHPPPPKHTSTPVPTARAPVTVLNNSRRTGLASAVADELRGKDWKIATVGNFQGLIPATTVYYAPGDKAAAVHLEHDFASVQRIEPNGQGNIHVSGLTLVVTRYWAL